MSEPQAIYETLLSELANGQMNELQRKVFDLLKASPSGLSRQDLVLAIFGYWPESIEGNTDDRKIRKAIEALRKRLFPILSTSGRPGYRLDVSRAAVEQMLSELRSRKARIDEQIEAASKFYQIPVTYTVDPKTVKQMELI